MICYMKCKIILKVALTMGLIGIAFPLMAKLEIPGKIVTTLTKIS